MTEQDSETNTISGYVAADSLAERMRLLSIGGPDMSEISPKAEEVSELFARDRLLARAMTPLHIEKQADGTFAHSFRVWDEELDLMEKGEMKYTSCTLLVPGETVPTYKTYGFLMDGDQSEVIHLSDDDSGSRGGEGDFWANPSEITTLDQLAESVRENKTKNMNEVNAHFTRESIKGIFAVEARKITAKIEALIASEHMKTRGIDVPLFVYNQNEGTLQAWQPTEEEVRSLVESVSSPEMKIVYARELAVA